ncbi:hypothetical protein [Myxococcus sp. CA051A]|nr:hypothetical protein [Myxococcus sp. CA051A]
MRHGLLEARAVAEVTARYWMKKPRVYNNGASFTAVFDKSGT